MSAEPVCCGVPFVCYQSVDGPTWMECPFDGCPGHGRENEPCWGEMRCYDEFGEPGDMVCMEVCNGHLDQAWGDMVEKKTPRPYKPEGT